MCFRCYVSQVIPKKKKLEGNRSEKTFTKRSNCKAKKYVPRIRFLLVQIVKIIHVRPLLVKLDLIAHLLLTKKMSPVFILLPIVLPHILHVNYHSKCTFTRGWHSTPNTFWGATSEVWSFQQKPLVTTEQHYVRISCSVSKKKGSIGWWFNWSTIFS